MSARHVPSLKDHPASGAEAMRPVRRRALQLVLVSAAIFYAVFILRTSFSLKGTLYFTLVDDAMVSMRYAHHLAQGYGIVWNVGEKPVEGFTNPAWMLLMAALHSLRIPASKISMVVMVVAAGILLMNGWVVYRICELLRPRSRYAPLIAVTITAFYFPLVFWSLRGMEVGALTLLTGAGVLVALEFTDGRRRCSSALLGLLFFLALLVRLDALLQISVILIYLIARTKSDRRGAGMPLLIVVLTLIGILWFQRVYFGDFLPNTFYQKVVGTSPEERIKNGLLVFNQYATRDTLLFVLSVAAAMWVYKDMRSRETALLACLFLVQCAYSIWVGGDYAEAEVGAANRFIAQGMPFLILLFSLAADCFMTDVAAAHETSDLSNPRLQSWVSVGVALGVLLVVSGQPWINWAIDNAPLLKSDIRRVKIGLAIAEYTSPTATIAVHAAGQIPYYSDRRTIDLLGLNDRVIAKGPVTGPFYPGHDKWNYDYSIRELMPDLIADNWTKLGDYMRDMSEYQQLENGMYVRKDSTLIDVNGLISQFR